jgi:hypothetical protein
VIVKAAHDDKFILAHKRSMCKKPGRQLGYCGGEAALLPATGGAGTLGN